VGSTVLLKLLGTKVLFVFLRVGWKPWEVVDNLGCSPLSSFLDASTLLTFFGTKGCDSFLIKVSFLDRLEPYFIVKGFELRVIVDFVREDVSGFVGVGAVAVEEATDAPGLNFL
jgi:hypothetical protein